MSVFRMDMDDVVQKDAFHALMFLGAGTVHSTAYARRLIRSRRNA